MYLSAALSPDQAPEDVLSSYLNATLNVNRGEGERIAPVFSVFYAHPSSSELPASPCPSKRIVPVKPPSARFPEFGDGAAEEAERVFWETIHAVGLKRESGGEQDEETVSSFWPPLEPEDTSAVDEW